MKDIAEVLLETQHELSPESYTKLVLSMGCELKAQDISKTKHRKTVDTFDRLRSFSDPKKKAN
jgi:hypothetical protein